MKKSMVVVSTFVFIFGLCTSFYTSASSVIDDYGIRDLEVFSQLFNVLNRTKTLAGREALQDIIKNPLCDYVALQKRQSAVKKIASDKVLREKIQHLLSIFHEHENYLVLHEDPVTSAAMKEMVKNFYFKLKPLEPLNDSALALDFLHIYEKGMIFSPVAEHFFLHVLKDAFSHGHHHSDQCHHHEHDHGHDHTCTVSLFENFFKSCGLSSGVIETVMWGVIVTHFLVHALSVKEMVEHIQSKNRVINHLYQMLAHVKQCIGAFSQLVGYVAENKQLSVSIGDFLGIETFTALDEADSFMKSIAVLEEGSFDANNTVGFFSAVGETLHCYKQIEATRDRFDGMLQFIGKIDAFVSLAQLYDDYADSDTCSFVNFIESDTPVIDCEAMWHPLLDKETAVSSDVLFDGVTSSHSIITGPNKAGKSTFIKAAALNVLLAQVGGFMFARRARMTPFSKIVTYINVSDDLCNDQSKFAAEVLRADQCMNKLKDLDGRSFGLCILDDSLFSSTHHEQTSKAAYSFVKTIGSLNNVISLTATHLPLLTQLEKDTYGIFKNYRIRLNSLDDGGHESSFTLEEGFSNGNDALRLVQSQGYTIYSD